MTEIQIRKKYYTGEQVQEIIRLATFHNQGKALWLLEKAAAMPAADVEEVNHEKLTDKEQRIFLAAIGREEKVCKEVDAEMTREPYEDSLVRVCKEIERKVKKALWTN